MGGRGQVPPSLAVTKLADNYDSDGDGCPRTPPLLPTNVRIKPTPSPEYMPQLPRSPSPDPVSASNHKGPKRRPKTQASQGDAVLIGFLGGSNFPDIATRAGEEPLNSASQSESGEPSDRMEEGDGGSNAVGEKSFSLIQTAQEAQHLVEATAEKQAKDYSNGPRALSKICTQDLESSANDKTKSDSGGLKVSKDGSDGPAPSYAKETPVAGYSTGKTKVFASRPSPPPSNRIAYPTERRSPFSLTTQLVLPEGQVPSEENMKLPAMSARSVQSHQLPPLHEHLESLLPPTSESDVRPNGINAGRHSLSLVSSTAHSPTVGSITSRPGRFSSPHGRLATNSFPYSQSQQSPPGTYSETSPRNFQQCQDQTASPLPKFQSTQFYGARGPQSDDLTPMSAESFPSTGNFSADTSPNGDHMNIEGRPVLPPLTSIPLISGSYKCDFDGCTALPFQTQYLLK